MSKLKNKKVIIALSVLVIIFVIAILIYNLTKPEEIVLVDDNVKNEEVYELYENVAADQCTDMDIDDAILYLVFTQMKRDNLLSDEIKLDDYNNALKKVLGDDNNKLNFVDYNYDGYSYKIVNDKIIREKTNCSNVKYVSKLYGYSYNDDGLELYVKLGYIDNNKVFDLDGVEIGDYNSGMINDVLERGTTKIYSYVRDGDSYYLSGVIKK